MLFCDWAGEGTSQVTEADIYYKNISGETEILGDVDCQGPIATLTFSKEVEDV